MEHVRLEPVSAERCVQEADVCVNLSSGGPFRGPRWDQLAGASTAEMIVTDPLFRAFAPVLSQPDRWRSQQSPGLRSADRRCGKDPAVSASIGPDGPQPAKQAQQGKADAYRRSAASRMTTVRPARPTPPQHPADDCQVELRPPADRAGECDNLLGRRDQRFEIRPSPSPR
jgi:hypothetical protein